MTPLRTIQQSQYKAALTLGALFVLAVFYPQVTALKDAMFGNLYQMVLNGTMAYAVWLLLKQAAVLFQDKWQQFFAAKRVAHRHTVDELCKMKPAEFDHWVSRYFAHKRYDTTILPSSGTRSIDMLVYKHGRLSAVQIRHHVFGESVEQKDIERFAAAYSGRYSAGIFVTTGTFSHDARKAAAQHRIQLIDGDALVRQTESAFPEDRYVAVNP